MTNNALIGATGFVGNNVLQQAPFNHTFSSANIQDIKGKSFDLVVCAGVHAEKWKANREPVDDLGNIEYLISNIRSISAKQFILISTVDVYPFPQKVNEDSRVEFGQLAPYGKHRFYLEKFTKMQFPSHTIIRLPGLIGTGLKKNFIFDMLYNPNALSLTHHKSMFQIYSLNTIWRDISLVLKNDIQLANFATPPLRAEEIAKECFGVSFTHVSAQPPVNYDMHTRYSWVFNHSGNYMYSKEQELELITDFVESERSSPG